MVQHKSDHDITFRPASKPDSEGIFRVLSSAFRLEEGSDRWLHHRNIAFGDAERFLVLEKAGEIIAALVISSHRLKIGTAEVLKGDVGEVSVHSELQGQGFGTQLMKNSVKYLQDKGFHLSRLGGLNRFYARFGYVPFPRRYYEFLLTNSRAGASSISPEEYLALTPEAQKCVRLYYPHLDWKRRNELYDSFNENRSGSLVKMHGSTQPSPSEPDPKSLNFVYVEDGQVYGYLFAYQIPEEVSPFEAKVIISDAAFQADKPEAFKVLMRQALKEVAKRGVQRVTARLPFDPVIQKLLTDATVPFSLQELQSAPASNMMAVINLPALLQTIAPELSRRCSLSFQPFSLHLKVDSYEANISVKPSSVELLKDAHADLYLSCDTSAFLRWLFGLNGFDEWRVGVSHNLNNEQLRVMSALFRREPCASGPWG